MNASDEEIIEITRCSARILKAFYELNLKTPNKGYTTNEAYSLMRTDIIEVISFNEFKIICEGLWKGQALYKNHGKPISEDWHYSKTFQRYYEKIKDDDVFCFWNIRGHGALKEN